MASENAKNVAKEVLETIRKGKLVNKGEILKKNGYSDKTATVPSLVTNTASYKSVTEPVVTQLEKLRQNILKELELKDLSEEKHRDLVASMDTMTKNIQLLGGKETEKVGITVNTINYGDTDTTPV
jgi:hypothetical protein